MFGPSLRADRLTPEESEVVMEDERASMLERLSEGDREKVEAAVSSGDLRADRLVKDYAPARNEGSNPSTDSSPLPNPKTRRCGTHAARVADDGRASRTAAAVDGSTITRCAAHRAFIPRRLDTGMPFGRSVN